MTIPGEAFGPCLERCGLARRGVVDRLLTDAGLVDGRSRIGPQPRTSRLSASGMPVQLCLSAASPAAGTVEARLLVDPFIGLAPDERVAQSMTLASAALKDGGWASALPEEAPAPAVGALWIAWPLTHKGAPHAIPESLGAAVYLNAELFGADPWPAIATFLDRILPPSPERQRLLSNPTSGLHAACVALEAKALAPLRARLYLRGSAAALRPLVPPHNGAAAFAHLIEIVRPRSGWPARGVTLAIGFDTHSGDPDGVKLDLCLCEACRKTANLEPGLAVRVQQMFPASASLEGVADLALLGAGIGGKGDRVNAYFEPC